MTNKINKKIIADNIKDLAVYYGFNIGDLETEVGVSQGYLSRLANKNSNDSIPLIDLMIAASEKFHVPVDSLISLDFNKITNPERKRLYLFLDAVLNLSNRGELDWERSNEPNICDEETNAGFVCHYDQNISFYIFELTNIDEEYPGYAFYVKNGENNPASHVVTRNIPGPAIYEPLRQLYEVAATSSEFFEIDEGTDLAIRHFMNQNSLKIKAYKADEQRKYRALYEHLKQENRDDFIMTFNEVEQILGFSLPISARKYNTFWANNRKGEHSYCKAWLDAGFETVETQKNTIEHQVRFRRIKK